MSRNATGEGSVFRRKDGRWVGTVFVDTVSGKRKRIYLYGKTRAEVHEALAERIREARRGIRTPDQTWTIGRYLTYWIDEVSGARNRPRTTEEYHRLAQNHLAGIGHHTFASLTPTRLQEYLNDKLARGTGARTIEAARALLRAALSHAERQELVLRNVAKLVQLPKSRPAPVEPWTTDEVARFLDAARGHRWYTAYVLLLHMGLRRGEVLGLTWEDFDSATETLQVRQQLQRIGGELQLAPLKTETSHRRLALVGIPAEAFRSVRRHAQAEYGLVFTSSTGTAVDPRNFGRVFQEIRQKAGLRRIKLHHTRHTNATLLKEAGVPDRDAQLILGHAHVTTTQQIYQHGDRDGMRAALTKLEHALVAARVDVKTDVNSTFSKGQGTELGALTSGGSSGARTHDTLLKSLLRAFPSDTVTSVTQHLRTRANSHILGFAAVKNCCQITSPGTREPALAEWLALARLPRTLHLMQLTQASFPYCLVGRKPADNVEATTRTP